MLGILALYGLSGAVGLAYEVLWVRMISLQFGISVFGVVITVAAFMLGLGLGAFLMNREGVKHPLRWLSALEVGVGIFSLALPQIAPLEQNLLMKVFSPYGIGIWHAGLTLVSMILLMLPAMALGAGFPLVLAAWRQRRASQGLGMVYGVNTIGAVFGALLPVILLPWLGWVHALQGVATMGILVGCGWGIMATVEESSRFSVPDNVSVLSVDVRSSRPETKLLWAYGLMGMAALSLEVAWTRLFSLLFLRTEYVLALILAIFLSGIGMGSIIGARYPLQRVRLFLPWLASGIILAGLAVLPWVAEWAESPHGESLFQALLWQGGMLVFLTLPVTFIFGLWFPLLGQSSDNASTNGVLLYAVNSVGGAIGALVTGFLWLPWTGTAGTVVLSAALILGASLFWTRPWKPVMGLGVLFILGAGGLLWHLPSAQRLLPQTLAGSHDLYRYEDAIAITQVVERPDGQRLLLTDLQRHDASTEPTAVFVQRNQGELPLLLHSGAGRVLFLGLGTGLSLAGTEGYPKLHRDAVELSQGAITAASQWFQPVDGDVLGQSTIYADDARHYLSTTRNTYDVIVGDLYHPDLSGVGALLSREQFQRARDHLNEDGLFVQWLALNQLDSSSLQVLLRTFRQVFPDARLFLDGMHLALVGPRHSWAGWPAVEHNLRQLDPSQQAKVTGGEGAMTWMGRYWGPIPKTVGSLQEEWHPVIDFDLPHVKYQPENLDALLGNLLEQRPTADQAALQLGLGSDQKIQFEKAYQATHHLVQSWRDRMTGREGEASRLVRLAFELNPADHWVGYALSDEVLAQMGEARLPAVQREQVVAKLAQRFPWQTDVLRTLWHLQMEQQDRDGAEMTRQALLQSSPLDREARSEKNGSFGQGPNFRN
ncbi:MAG: spermine synthase [Ferrovum sp.]|nr:spermine synthase [Ferrovum sp.]NDU86887.1 spermine synthase [Ferrovum sp.]